MEKEKQKIETAATTNEQAVTAKTKKGQLNNDTPSTGPKAKKIKAEKGATKKADSKAEKEPKVAKEAKAVKEPKAAKEPKVAKEPKAVKEDKPTKFMVSMKKSVRKSIKKEAAEAGISMNEYIVLAVGEKLSGNDGKANP